MKLASLWNWKSEAERFVTELDVVIFDPKDKAGIDERWKSGRGEECARVFVTTYGLMVEHAEADD